jgi:aminoglycoside phosphotransferase
MNFVLAYLNENWRRLDLTGHSIPKHPSCVLVTPRFRVSSHVVFLVLARDQSTPVLVVKVPRLSGANEMIEREAANLRMIQAAHPGGFDSIPRVIAFEAHCGRQILVETALVGRPMDPPTVRRNPAACCHAVTSWLTDVQTKAVSQAKNNFNWFEPLIERPLRYFASVVPLSDEENRLVERTWDLLTPLRWMRLPLVTDHGDLSHPNIILLENGGLGVVDWELADPLGLPAHDLFFFLTYVAFARHKARARGNYLRPFHDAFFKDGSWTSPYIKHYAEQLQLSSRALTPLFILTWVRYVAGFLTRANRVGQIRGQLDLETTAWLRVNRYYQLWRHAVTHVDELNWDQVVAEGALKPRNGHAKATNTWRSWSPK